MSGYITQLIGSICFLKKQYGILTTMKVMLARLERRRKQKKIQFKDKQIIETNGYRLMIVPGDKGISSELLMYNIHEPITTQLFEKELKPGMICLDVGSNIGYYAMLESKLIGKTGKVIAIEPSPINYEYLKKNTELQPIKNIETYRFAASDKSGTIKFLVSEKSNLSKVIEDDENIENNNIITVDSRTLDSFVLEKELKQIDLIRMDVEGYEYKIFQGMNKILEKFNPMIIMEFHKSIMGEEKSKQLIFELKEKGYELKHYIPREIDIPTINDLKYIQTVTSKEFIEKIEKKLVPDNFHLFFKKNENKKSS